MIPKSFQRSLPLIVAALALPLVILIIFEVRSSLETDRMLVEQAALARAEQIDALTDARVEADFAAMRVPATASAIKAMDWRAAYFRSQEVAKVNPHWRTVVVSDLIADAEMFNLRRPYGEAASGLVPEIAADARPDRPTAGSVTRNGAGCPCVYLHLPLSSTDGRQHVLSVGIDPALFQSILIAHVAEGTVAGLVDRGGRFLARSIDFPSRVGTPATEFVLAAVARGGQGFYEGRTYEGFENYTAYHTSPLTGWSTHIAVASGLIDRPRFLSSATLLIGTSVVLVLAAALVGYTLYDLAQRRRADEAFAQSQRMEALGRLTGGVAHDFNNLLTVIIGGLDLLLAKLEDPKAKRLASNALEAARKGEQLTHQLLAFSRGQSMEIGAVDVGKVLSGMEALLRRTLGSDVRLRVKIDERARWVTSNANQLELAILNLAINARDAMPKGGHLKIETRSVPQNESEVRIIVSDTGFGMAAEVAARALEPFFTTKAEGKGSGLGLAQVFGIVRQSGGTMSVRSEPGKGTRIILVLPRSCPHEAAGESGEAASPLPSRGDNRSILVVDDDHRVRAFMTEALREAGFQVLEAGDGATALQTVETAAPDLLLTDYSMPGMTGVELAQRLRSIRAGLPVMIVSGYSDAEAVKNAVPDAPLLWKPFSAAELVQAVNAALARQSRA